MFVASPSPAPARVDEQTPSPHPDQPIKDIILRSARSGWVLLAAGLILVALCLPAAISAVATPRQNQDAATASPIGTSRQVAVTAATSTSPTTKAARPPLPAVVPQSGLVPSSLEAAGRFSAPVDPVAATPDGKLMIPADAQRVGWWSGGSAPGDFAGSVVLVGHLDTPTGGLGVFYQLLHLTAGQALVVKDTTGGRHAYTVTAREQIKATSLPPSLFDRTGPPRLVLITCGGNYDRVHHRYEDNTIVVATPS